METYEDVAVAAAAEVLGIVRIPFLHHGRRHLALSHSKQSEFFEVSRVSVLLTHPALLPLPSNSCVSAATKAQTLHITRFPESPSAAKRL